MIGFVETIGGVSMPLAGITSVSPVRDRVHGTYTTRVRYLKWGEDTASLQVSASEWDMALERPVQLLPAQPGTKLVYANADEEDAFLIRMPLIAWALCVDGVLRPVTPAGVDDGPCSGPSKFGWYVELPDGGFYGMAEGDACNSEDELKSRLIAYYDQRKSSEQGVQS